MRATARPGRLVSIAGVAAGALVLTGCAGASTVAGSPARPAVGSESPRPSATASAGWSCGGAATGFALSLAMGVAGSPTPEQAARTFVLNGATPGFGDDRSVWIVQQRDGAGASVVSGRVRLHTLKVSDGGWAVDSGQRCGD